MPAAIKPTRLPAMTRAARPTSTTVAAPTRHAKTWCPHTVSTPTRDGSPRSAGHAGGCEAVGDAVPRVDEAAAVGQDVACQVVVRPVARHPIAAGRQHVPQSEAQGRHGDRPQADCERRSEAPSTACTLGPRRRRRGCRLGLHSLSPAHGADRPEAPGPGTVAERFAGALVSPVGRRARRRPARRRSARGSPRAGRRSAAQSKRRTCSRPAVAIAMRRSSSCSSEMTCSLNAATSPYGRPALSRPCTA